MSRLAIGPLKKGPTCGPLDLKIWSSLILDLSGFVEARVFVLEV